MNDKPASEVRRRLMLASACAWGASLPCVSVSAQQKVPNAKLLSHDGRTVRLRSDVWQDKFALVHFFFTGCSTFCRPQASQLASLQKRLADRLGRDVIFISLTLDPLADTPEVLAAFSRPFNPGPHWWWLTGDSGEVRNTLLALGADLGNPTAHGPIWVTGRAEAPTRVVGFPTVVQLEALALGGGDKH